MLDEYHWFGSLFAYYDMRLRFSRLDFQIKSTLGARIGRGLVFGCLLAAESASVLPPLFLSALSAFVRQTVVFHGLSLAPLLRKSMCIFQSMGFVGKRADTEGRRPKPCGRGGRTKSASWLFNVLQEDTLIPSGK